MKILIASDHAGFLLKKFLVENLKNDHEVYDLGTDSENACDYPIFANKLKHLLIPIERSSEKPYDQNRTFGVLICGSGIGMSIAANRYPEIRAALCFNEKMSKMARRHNNANVIVLGSKIIDNATAIECVNRFIMTDFEGGRHTNRLHLVNELAFGEKK